MSPYTSPVSELLSIGTCDWKEWHDYSQYEFNESHVPELLQLARDWPLLNHDDDEMVWAPIHAWRVLGILQRPEAVEPFIKLFYKDDETFVVSEYLPSVVGRLGAVATPALWSVARDTEESEDVRDLAIESLRWNASYHDQDRDETIQSFMTLLDDRDDDEIYLNTCLVGALADLKAKEAAKTIHDAFDRGLIDRQIHGDFEDVELELGLRTERTTIPDWRFDQHQQVMLEQILEEQEGMTFRSVEGLLFAMACSPQPVPPTRWMKIIFGDSPKFASEQQEKDVHRMLFNLFDLTEHHMDAGLDILPLECRAETADSEKFAELQLWSLGFGEGNAMMVNFWEEVFQHKAMKDLEESWTACTILLSVWSNPDKLLEKSKEKDGPNIEKMLSAVPSVAKEMAHMCRGLQTRWKAVMETPDPVRAEKVGRNDPCPCGSGKKYKKCCGK